MPIKLNSPGGGSITLDVPNMSTANTLTLPAITGNVITSADSNTVTQSMINRAGFYGGFGPAFSAYCSATNQTVSSATWTKVQINTEEFDTASCFDSTTNYRFTPNVAGYYQINFTVATLATSSMTVYAGAIYKNGTLLKYAGINGSFSANAANLTSLAQLIYLNGSTDYIEFYGFVTGTGTLSIYGSQTYLTAASGFLARPA
jgi:hypothetical protein